uniref:Coat protein n=1 Tax=Tapera partitivirus TaxID=3078417 RepID=A0AB38Z1R1_9VIRU
MNRWLRKHTFLGHPVIFRLLQHGKKIYSGATLLPAIQDETYNQMCATNPSYTKCVPKCAHDYYLGILAYSRFLKLHSANGGRINPEEGLFVTQVSEFDFKVPKSFSLFLSGFGNTKIPSGRDIHFAMVKPSTSVGQVTHGEAEVNEIPGYFGAIMEILGAYSSYPCPGVYAQRILQDLLHPPNEPNPKDWDLPVGFRAENKPINYNCLGYSPSVRLSSEHRHFLSSAGVSKDRFDFGSDVVPVLYELMNAVHMKLMSTRMTLHSFSTSTNGSTGQLPTEIVESQSSKRAVGAKYIAKTSIDLPAAQGFLGSSFLYNVCKSSENDYVVKSLMPVKYKADDTVDPPAREGLNLLYTLTTEMVKLESYETISYSPNLRLGDIVKVDFGQ